VTSPASLAAAAATIASAGPANLVFVNAGAIVLKPFAETSDADWRWLFDVNLFGTVNAVRAFLPGLLAQQAPARLVVTSSIQALRPPSIAGQTIYTATKAAQFGFCQALRAELAGSNVALSILFPSAVSTAIRSKSEARHPGAIGGGAPGKAGGVTYLSPEEAGERILTEVEAGAPFITTHPGEGPKVRAEMEQILAAFAG